MNNIICAVGTLKEDYLKAAVAEYVKRLERFGKTRIVELKETNKEKETDAIFEFCIKNKSKNTSICLLDINGENPSSIEMANRYEKLQISGISTLIFIIGGSEGVAERLEETVDWRLSFGCLTYPHQLMRVLLLEQLYRVNMILSGAKYHK
jgi:23S rRNA (pseudouridine1915-N3)-methyltransferase